MIVPLAFWLFLLGALATGWRAGDQRDRKVIMAVASAAFLTMIAQFALRLPWESIAIVAINFLLLAIVARYALTSHRYWPIWFTGFQAATCSFSLAALFLDPGAIRQGLALAAAFWTLPGLIVLCWGLLADQRAGVSNRL